MKKAIRWLTFLCLSGFVLVWALPTDAQVPPGYEPQVKLLNPEVSGDASANSSGNSAAMTGGSDGAQSARSGGFKSWLADRGMGLVKGIGAGLIGAALVVGVAALVVGAGAPLLLMAGAAVLGGAIYGALVGSKDFNWTEAIVGSIIGGVSAGVGSWIAGTGSPLLTRAGVAAVDMVGGGIASTASYLIHTPSPTLGGVAAAFGIGAGTAGLFMGGGAVVSKGWKWAKGALGFGKAGKNVPNSAVADAALPDGNSGPLSKTTNAGRHRTLAHQLADDNTGPIPETEPSKSVRPKHATTPPEPGEAIQWPSNDGFHGERVKTMLQPGTLVDRYGRPGGNFLSPEGTPFGNRALPPHYETAQPYHVYEVVKPLEVEAGLIEPWFGQPGMGTQYLTSVSVQDLLDAGVLREVSRQ